MEWLKREWSKLTLLKVGAFAAGVAAVAVVVSYCISSKNELLWLLAVAGAVAGWVVGVLAAPLSKDEEARFGELAKVISGFITGYLLSKLDPVIAALVNVPEGGQAAILAHHTSEQILVTLSSFGIALVVVFSGRLYWTTPATEAVLQKFIESQSDKPSRAEALERLAKKAS